MKNIKISQFETLPMGGAEPAAPPTETFKIIYSPLRSLGLILADLDFKSYLQNNFGTTASDLAHEVWVMYGGSENELDEGKPGKRKDAPASSDLAEQEKIQQAEHNATRNSRWERLPEGVRIEEITSPQILEKAIIGGFDELSRSKKQQPTAQIKKWIKAANVADNNGNYIYADKIQKIINNVIQLLR